MASTSTTPETLVTVKVNYDGSTRRFKLSLRDMGASTLEDKVRHVISLSLMPIGQRPAMVSATSPRETWPIS